MTAHAKPRLRALLDVDPAPPVAGAVPTWNADTLLFEWLVPTGGTGGGGPETDAAALAALADHAADQTNVHGIPDTAALATDSDVAAEVAARAAADATLTADLADEGAARVAADSALAVDFAADLADETTARTSGDTALDVRVDALEVAPPAHIHPQSDVTGLPAALAAKQDAASAATDAELAAAVATLEGSLQARSEKGQPNGYAGLDGAGKLATGALPAIALVDVSVVASQAAQLALVAQEGDVAVRTDVPQAFIHNGGVAGTMADWTLLPTPADQVLSVAGKTGAVVLAVGDVGGLQAALDGKATAVHVHAIADVTGLQAALDGKADDADVTAMDARVDTLEVALPDKQDAATAATDAELAAEATARTNGDNALDARLDAIEGLGSLATDAELAAEATARTDGDTALDVRLDAIEGLGSLATDAELAAEATARAAADTAITDKRALSGKGFVNHGADPNVARPTGYASVEWFGSVEPVNMANGDTGVGW